MSQPRTICIAGASGLAGAYALRAALAAGHHVRATVRDLRRAEQLYHLPGATERLRLFEARTETPESFAAPLAGVEALVLACFPTPRRGLNGEPISALTPERAWCDVVTPSQTACRAILERAARAGVATAVLCSSTASAAPEPAPPVLQESDVSSLTAQRAAGKVMQAQKTAMEEAARAVADQSGLRLVVLLSSMMVAPPLMPWHLEGHGLGFLAGLAGGRPGWHARVPEGAMSLTHPADLAGCILRAIATPEVAGRYFTLSDSWTWARIYQEIARYVPPAALPAPNAAPPALPTVYDFKRRDSLKVAFTPIPQMLRTFFESLPAATALAGPCRTPEA